MGGGERLDAQTANRIALLAGEERGNRRFEWVWVELPDLARVEALGEIRFAWA